MRRHEPEWGWGEDGSLLMCDPGSELRSSRKEKENIQRGVQVTDRCIWYQVDMMRWNRTTETNIPGTFVVVHTHSVVYVHTYSRHYSYVYQVRVHVGRNEYPTKIWSYCCTW